MIENLISNDMCTVLLSYAVVVPVFNNSSELYAAVKSIACQSIPPTIIIVVDDASTFAKTRVILNTLLSLYPSMLEISFHLKNEGASNARNTGILIAKKYNVDLIAFCDADDKWHIEKMRKQMPLFEVPGIQAVGSQVQLGSNWNLPGTYSLKLLTKFDLLTRNYIQPSTLVVRTLALNAIGPFPQNRRYAEEGDLYLRLAEYGTIARLELPLVIYYTNSSPSILAPVTMELQIQKNRLSENVLSMYFGCLLNLYNCRSRRSLSFPLFLIFVLLLCCRFLRRISRGFFIF